MALAVLPALAQAGKDNVYAIVGARVVPVSGPTLDSGTLLIRDGLIEAVGRDVAIPPDARVIDGKGLTLTPGLIDGFGGIGLPAPPPRSAGGGGPGASPPPATGVAPQALALDKVQAAEALKARDTGITTALVIAKDGVVPGRSVLLNLSGDTPAGMVLRQPAALHLQMATQRREYPSSLMGTMAMARQALYDAAHYREEWTAYLRSPRGKKRPRYDAGLEAWADVVDGRLPLVVTASRENDVRRAVALRDEFKVKLIVAGAPQAFRVTEVLRARRLPLLVSVNYDPPRPVSFFGPEDDEKEAREIEDAQRNPAKLHQAEVAFALVSGHARDFVGGVRKAIDKGLPREAALRAVTLAPAEVWGLADVLGSLESGKIADVVAWSGEPLAKETKAKLVFVDGQLYEPEEKEKPKKDEEAGR